MIKTGLDSDAEALQVISNSAKIQANRKALMAEPETKSIFDTPLDEAEEIRLDVKAEAEIDSGHGVPHEQVREWLMKLAQGDKGPPPVA